MNPIKSISAIVILAISAWLGLSFSVASEPTPEQETDLGRLLLGTAGSTQVVGASHPDSHRRGMRVPEEIAAPVLPAQAPDKPDTFILDLAQH